MACIFKKQWCQACPPRQVALHCQTCCRACCCTPRQYTKQAIYWKLLSHCSLWCLLKYLLLTSPNPLPCMLLHPPPIYLTGHILESIVPLLIVMFIKIFIYYVHIARKKTKNWWEISILLSSLPSAYIQFCTDAAFNEFLGIWPKL